MSLPEIEEAVVQIWNPPVTEVTDLREVVRENRLEEVARDGEFFEYVDPVPHTLDALQPEVRALTDIEMREATLWHRGQAIDGRGDETVNNSEGIPVTDLRGEANPWDRFSYATVAAQLADADMPTAQRIAERMRGRRFEMDFTSPTGLTAADEGVGVPATPTNVQEVTTNTTQETEPMTEPQTKVEEPAKKISVKQSVVTRTYRYNNAFFAIKYIEKVDPKDAEASYVPVPVSVDIWSDKKDYDSVEGLSQHFRYSDSEVRLQRNEENKIIAASISLPAKSAGFELVESYVERGTFKSVSSFSIEMEEEDGGCEFI
jgi:hypothetical protein